MEAVDKGEWDASLNVYHLVEVRLKPFCAGTGYGYALHLNADDPKEVNTMVSHAWSENALEFLETIVRSTDERDSIFICAFSLYQCEDGHGPSIEEQLGTQPNESPFQRVLEHIHEQGTQNG